MLSDYTRVSPKKKTDWPELIGKAIGGTLNLILQAWILTVAWGVFVPDIFHLDPLTMWQAMGIVVTLRIFGNEFRRSGTVYEA